LIETVIFVATINTIAPRYKPTFEEITLKQGLREENLIDEAIKMLGVDKEIQTETWVNKSTKQER